MGDRWILHVDMDEFFAAVEKLDRPELRGKPLLVGGRPKARGVVSTASYEARRYGCRSAMPMATAVRLCPDAVVLPVRGDRYAEVSEQVFAIFESFTPLVEPLSIDEAFLDVTGSRALFGPAEHIARQVKQRIREETGLTASVGVASNKFLAKLASDLEKPDGLVVIRPEDIRPVLDPLPVSKLWGLGPSSDERLRKLGIETIGQLRRMEPRALRTVFGDAAERFRQLADGIDDRPVVPDSRAKSIGREQTFPDDIGDLDELRSVLLAQIEHVARRLHRQNLAARTLTLKLRTGDFTTVTRSTTLDRPTALTQELWRAVEGVLSAWAARHGRPLRLLGVTASQLTPSDERQLSLFGDRDRSRLAALDRAVDDIVERFGDGAIRRATTHRRDRPHPEAPGETDN
ncbi:MAG: DNA polymerase IV [bacterium]